VQDPGADALGERLISQTLVDEALEPAVETHGKLVPETSQRAPDVLGCRTVARGLGAVGAAYERLDGAAPAGAGRVRAAASRGE
jgi:hypothetical protein